MWTVEPEQIWKKSRLPGISGFMRLKNEAAFLDRAFASHIDGLDELIVVFNDCQDETPDICARWARRYPEKISVIEYEPKIVPIGTAESLTIDPRSPRCIANYYNYALSLTNRQIAIKIDGDHLAAAQRFKKVCDRVRRSLPRKRRYPIYGLNITTDEQGRVGIYNYYNYSPQFSVGGFSKKGPPAFTSGDHAFYYVDETSWHTVDPVEGFERMDLGDKPRFPGAALTYTFLHMKGMKPDKGTGNWAVNGQEDTHVRTAWIENVMGAAEIVSIEAMRRHNPSYFRGVDVADEIRQLLPNCPLRAVTETPLPALRIRERLADLWYRVTYP